jgi:hypothetical protein
VVLEQIYKRSDDQEELKRDINNTKDKYHENIRKDISANQEELNN